MPIILWACKKRENTGWTDSSLVVNTDGITTCAYASLQARIQRGDRGSGTPPEICKRWGLCVEAWWVGEGVQRLFLPFYYQFYYAKYFANILHVYKYIYTSKFNVQYGHSNPYSIFFPYSNYETITSFYERAFSYFFLSRFTRFYTDLRQKFSGGGQW